MNLRILSLKRLSFARSLGIAKETREEHNSMQLFHSKKSYQPRPNTELNLIAARYLLSRCHRPIARYLDVDWPSSHFVAPLVQSTPRENHWPDIRYRKRWVHSKLKYLVHRKSSRNHRRRQQRKNRMVDKCRHPIYEATTNDRLAIAAKGQQSLPYFVRFSQHSPKPNERRLSWFLHRKDRTG